MLPSISYRLRGIISEQKVINRAQNTGNLDDIVLFSPMTTQIHSFSNA